MVFRLIVLLLIIATLSAPSLYAETSFHFLSKGQADALYCPLGACGGTGGGGNYSFIMPWLYQSADDVLFNESHFNKSLPTASGNTTQEIRHAINSSPIYYGIVTNNSLRWKGTVLDGSCITPGTQITCRGGNLAEWTAQPLFGWNDVLDINKQTSGTDPIITSGDRIRFGTALGKTNASIMQMGDNTLNISALKSEAGVQITGNLSVLQGNYLVEANSYAFLARGFLAGLLFDGGADGGYEFHDTSANTIIKFGAVAPNTGDIMGSSNSRMELGDQGLNNIIAGAINVTTVHYDAVDPNSPSYIIKDEGLGYTLQCFDDSDGGITGYYFDNGKFTVSYNHPACLKQRDKVSGALVEWENYQLDRDACIYQGKYNEYAYTEFGAYIKGSRDCNISKGWKDYHCKIDYGELYDYDINSDKCIFNKARNCTRYIWRFWDDKKGACIINPYSKCKYDQPKNMNKSFNYDNMSCVIDWEKECENRGFGWIWDGKTCYLDPNKTNNDQREECESRGNKWLWDGYECISLY